MRALVQLVYAGVDLALLLPCFATALLSRLSSRRVDVGLGPRPLINHVHHKRALDTAGYSAETYVNELYYITRDFDRDLSLPRPWNYLSSFRMLVHCFWRYRCLYIGFDGGPLGSTRWLWRLEPLLCRIAGVRVVILPYGSDVQELSRSPNLEFVHALGLDYPDHRLKRRRIAASIDLWTRRADHIIAGAEWVDYLYHWDTLMLAHFSIDAESWRPEGAITPGEGPHTRPLRVLHAPNHRAIKGTLHLERAVEILRAEGIEIELILLERVSNAEIREAMTSVDIVADQLVIGAYAMFAIEAMALGRPTLCHIRPDLERLWIRSGLLDEGELPLLKCTPETLVALLRDLSLRRAELAAIGKRSREFVLRHHSVEAVGSVFARINRSIGLEAGVG